MTEAIGMEPAMRMTRRRTHQKGPRTADGARRFRGIGTAVLLVLSAAGAAFGQQAELSGSVKDSTGGVIPNASITLRNPATGRTRATTASEAGLYSIPLLDPGDYTLTAMAPGFETRVVEGLNLEVGAKMIRNLELSVGNTSQTVTVSDSGIYVNAVDASVSAIVDRQFVENMPLNGRSFQSLLTMVPGVTVVPSQGTGFGGEVSVNGQRTEANYFLIDGVSANTGALTINNSSGVGRGAGFSGSTSTQSALGTTQSLVPVDALQEFRATTSSYSAEHGRVPGGQFSFQTRSGTNDLHGAAFNYFRNDALDANNWFNNQSGLPRQAERQNDFGGTLGGPVLLPGLYDGRNRTFFFFAYEGLRLRTPQSAVTYDVPSLELRAAAPDELKPFLNAFPLPNGAVGTNGLASFTGSYSSPSNLDNVGIRLDHSFSDLFKVFGRFSYSPSDSSSRQTPNLANVSSVDVNVRTLTLGATNILSPSASNEFRFNTTWNDSLGAFTPDDFGGATPFDMSSVPGLNRDNANLFLYLNFGLRPVLRIIPRDIRQKQFNFTDSFTAVLGRHTLKFGVDFRQIRNWQPLPSVYEYPVFSNAEQILANQPQFVTLFTFADQPMRPVYNNFSAFVQDEWKITSRLNLSLGLRWDVNPAPYDAGGNDPYNIDQADDLATMKLSPQGTPLWKTAYRNFAPRIGVAYQLRRTAGFETVLRSGFGLFYDTGNTLGTMGYWGAGISGSKSFTGVTAPLTEAQIDTVPQPDISTPYATTVYGFDPNLKLPYTLQWNASVEQSLGDRQSLTIGYIGSAGRRLLLWRQYYPGRFGNTNFKSDNSFGNSLQLTINGADSSYHALQMQFQRKLLAGLQLRATYTWSHSIDTSSTNFMVYHLLRASSDFDIRHNFQSAITYDLPRLHANRIAGAIWNGFAIDARISARSALPVDLVGATALDLSSGSSVPFHPDVVAGEPIYIDDANVPGGRRINFAAFTAAANGVDGSAGRNFVRGFSAVQTDLALRRNFHLSERFKLEFRAEAFNVFNHPIFGNIYNDLSYGSALFGNAYATQNVQLGGLSSLYQSGGPRSLQLALKLRF